jgi:hypothetical protein
VPAITVDKSGAGHTEDGHICCESHPITDTNRASTPPRSAATTLTDLLDSAGRPNDLLLTASPRDKGQHRMGIATAASPIRPIGGACEQRAASRDHGEGARTPCLRGRRTDPYPLLASQRP